MSEIIQPQDLENDTYVDGVPIKDILDRDVLDDQSTDSNTIDILNSTNKQYEESATVVEGVQESPLELDIKTIDVIDNAISDPEPLPSFSYNDHYKWGFNNGWFNDPEPYGFFKNQIGSCARPHQSFREECIIAAGLLGSTLTKPILVGLSGGNDSQVVCLSFLNAGVPFNPVILRTHNGAGYYYNNHDTAGAYAFCEKYGLDPITEELDLDAFFSGPAWDIIKKYGVTVCEMTIQLYLVKKYARTHAYVNGGGDPNISYRQNDDLTSDLVYGLGPTPIQQFMLDNHIQGCLKFFMYTPELITSFLNNDIMKSFIQARDQIYRSKITDPFMYCAKPMFYIKEWPEIVQQLKHDGFERVTYMRHLRHFTHLLHDHINPRAKKVVWPLDQILDHLLNGGGETKIWISDED